MSSYHRPAHGRGAGNRHHHGDAQGGTESRRRSHAEGARWPVQGKKFVPPHFPFQPLPTPRGQPPYHFGLSDLLHEDAVKRITDSGRLVLHSVGDTGDLRGKEMDFVAAMMTEDFDGSPDGLAPACFYHLGDVVYFAGDIDDYGTAFYETYAEYPALIVSIPGNHDCQPDDPQDGPMDPDKVPLDGWVQNFMSDDPNRLGSLKTTSSRTQMNLPNVYWTFTTPFATIIGLFSNVSETEAEVDSTQLAWFRQELSKAPADKALIVAIHHPPFSADTEHAGSSAAEQVLFDSFEATGRYPHLILSGHVHNYQRFTVQERQGPITCLVAGNGGYSKLGRLHKVDGEYPSAPLQVSETLTLDSYDQENFGFLRLEITKQEISVTYLSAFFQETKVVKPAVGDRFTIPLSLG